MWLQIPRLQFPYLVYGVQRWLATTTLPLPDVRSADRCELTSRATAGSTDRVSR
jgi:hypothetical protein